MKRLSLLSLLSLACILCLSAQNSLSLEEALRLNKIKLAAEGVGGYQGQKLQLAIKSNMEEAVEIEIPAGQIFASEDSNLQDLIVTAPEKVRILPKLVSQVLLFTMCIQSGNWSPRQGARFRIGDMADGPLMKLIQTIAKGHYQNSTAQSAVWSITNNNPIREIYGSDTSMVRDIAEVVSEITQTPLARFHLLPRRHEIQSIQTSMDAYLTEYADEAALRLYADGEMIREYFDERKVEPGYLHFPIGVHHSLGDSVELILKLEAGDQNLFTQTILPTDTVQQIQKIKQEVVLTYKVEQAGRARLGIYDSADRLVFIIADRHPQRVGIVRGTLRAQCYVPKGAELYMKVKMHGKTLASKKLNLGVNDPKFFEKRKVEGSFNFRQESRLQNVQLALYDRDGELRKVLYDIHRLNPGPKRYRYQFEHVDGPDSWFYLRLTNKDGKVLKEKRIRG